MKVLCTRYSKKLGRGQKKRCHKELSVRGVRGARGEGGLGFWRRTDAEMFSIAMAPPPRLSGLNYHHSD